jgi:hypothetical protein
MGKHQYLPNDNILIVIPDEGRIVEVTKRGEKVLEFNNVLSDTEKFNAHVENGLWLPENFFKQIPGCSGDQP